MKTNKVVLVYEIGDPFESPTTVAVCTNVEAAKQMFSEELWSRPKRVNDDNRKQINLITGEEYIYGTFDNSTKSPYIEEVKLNKFI